MYEYGGIVDDDEPQNLFWAYPDYRKAKEEMQELLRAKRNVEMFFAEEKSIAEKMKSR